MPYTTNADLPKAVRGKLSDHQQTVFRNVFNSMMGEDGMTESRAFAGAWSKAKDSSVKKMEIQGQILKLDKKEQIVYGWASVISENNIPVVDTQGDIIDAETLVKATTDFMLHSRTAKSMHVGEQKGTFVHSFPLTNEIKNFFGIICDKEGWIVAAKVQDQETWKRVESGDFTGFSIGGRAKRVNVRE